MPDESDVLDGEISLLDLALMVADRWRAVAWISANSVIVALAVSFFVPQRYRATVTLLPPKRNESLAMTLAVQSSVAAGAAATSSARLNVDRSNDMYAAMLQSHVVEDGVIERFDLMREYHSRRLSDARKSLESHVVIDGHTLGGLLRIDVDDNDPVRAAKIASGYVDEFRGLSQQLAITEASQRRLFLEKQLRQTKDHMGSAEEALKETEQRTGMIQLDSQASALIQMAAALRASITATEIEIQGMQTYAASENSRLEEAQQELKGLRSELDQLGGNKVSDGDLLLPRARLTAAGLEHARRVREVKYYETLYESLAGQLEVARLDEVKQGSIVQVVDPALPADKRSFPQRGSIVVGTSIAGFLAGISYALCAAGLNHLHSQPQSHAKLEYLTHLVLWKAWPGTEGPAK